MWAGEGGPSRGRRIWTSGVGTDEAEATWTVLSRDQMVEG